MTEVISIGVLAYNHEKFIAKTLDGILEQKCNYSFKIYIIDDYSSDNTLKILKQYQTIYPDKINVIQNESNLGIISSVYKLSLFLQGDYFAMFDGDDYWDYAQKLQKQVDFLERNIDFIATFHDARIISENVENNYFHYTKTYSQSYKYNEVIFPVDILNRLIIPTSSLIFRKEAIHKIWNELNILNEYFSLDWKLFSVLIKNSKFYYFNEPWSVYHNHQSGISKGNKLEFHLSHIKFLKLLLKDNFYKDYKYAIYGGISKEYNVLLNSNNTIINKRILFLKYCLNEVKRIWYYRNELFK
jgi:glycosyltransferase involved in cell wall biosynthesis